MCSLSVRILPQSLAHFCRISISNSRYSSTHTIIAQLNACEAKKFELSDRDSFQRLIQTLSEAQRNQLRSELQHCNALPQEEKLGSESVAASRLLVIEIEPNLRPLEYLQDKPSVQSNLVITTAQYRNVFLHQALPFVGFGFLDNLIMILAGDYIDATLGVTLGISTMAAAGLGNAISDVAGIGSAFYVESICSKVGIKKPKLSSSQEKRGSVRFAVQSGRVVGIVIGCLIGMFPLLFLPDNRSNENESKKK